MFGMNLAIPLGITRRGLYIATLLGAVFLVLLPFSVIGYHEFYRGLIPKSSPRIPLRFHKSNSMAVDVTATKVPGHIFKFDPLLSYKWQIHLNVVCGDSLQGRVVQLDWLVYQLEEVYYEDTFILDCDARSIHSTKNRFVPFNLRFWVPPVVVDINRDVDILLDKFHMPGHILANPLDKFTIQVEPTPGLLINNENSYLDFQIKFTGFRYYLRRHYIFFGLIGILACWGINSLIAVTTALLVLGTLNVEESEYDFKMKDNVPLDMEVVKEEDDLY
ncbi:hypothetical protein JNB11_04830 [Kocuria palustris]|nr:hypothetical protein [Kocuria palustris]